MFFLLELLSEKDLFLKRLAERAEKERERERERERENENLGHLSPRLS